MTMKPLRDQYIVERLKRPDKTGGGIIVLPSTSYVKNKICKVIAIGDKNPLELSPGDYVVVLQYDGTVLDPRNPDVIILEKDMIATKLEGNEEDILNANLED